MSQPLRWQQRFEHLTQARAQFLRTIDAYAREPENDIYRIALIGAFEFTYELAWKTLKDFLNYQGVEVSLPRDVLRSAFAHGLMEDGACWMDMLQDRNVLAHSYDAIKAKAAADTITTRYQQAISQVYGVLEQKVQHG